jgi:hypothetical protein
MNAEEILLMKMADFVFVDKRPFCFKDFLRFEHEGQEYKYAKGTIRNKFSELQRKGDIEFSYRSGPAFYTLPGITFGKPMTVNHMEEEGHLSPKQSTFLQTLQSIPMDKPAIHDIRLSFTFKHLWSILSVSESPLIKSKDLESNFDITLQPVDLENHIIKTTVHRTDTVSVIVGCSVSPIPIDLFGLARLTSIIARVEERLQLLVNEYYTISLQTGRQYLSLTLNSKIPDHMNWMVKMWHFGQDALISYTGEKFDMSWEDGLHVLHHIYSKNFKKKQ